MQERACWNERERPVRVVKDGMTIILRAFGVLHDELYCAFFDDLSPFLVYKLSLFGFG
jgi:hypothetical protein